jgi:leucyl-tRNA synthetase
MPNLWSNAKQKIYEVFKGPRTDDLDFNEKVKELETMYNSIEKISTIYQNIHNHTQGIKYLYEDISQLQDIYDKQSSYHEAILSILQSFQKLTNNYDVLVNYSNIV